MRLLFDLESNGLLDRLDTIHSLVIQDLDTNTIYSCSDAPPFKTKFTPLSIDEGVRLLETADELWGHNIQEFDIPALQKVYPTFSTKKSCKIRDTLIISKLIWSDMKDKDFKWLGVDSKAPIEQKRLRAAKKGFSLENLGRHSLKAWGQRLSNNKGDFNGPWDAWCQTMQDYCEQDVMVNRNLVDKILEKNYSEIAIQLEHDFAKIIRLQEKNGVQFNVSKCMALVNTLLADKQIIEEDLKTNDFPERIEFIGKAVPSKSRTMRKGCICPTVYTSGAEYSKIALVEFNPGSSDHIAKRLKDKYGWKPKLFTANGKPKIDEKVLRSLEYPEAKKLLKIAVLDKRLGQIYSGKNAWMKKYDSKTNRIHGTLDTNGAVTGRCTHRLVTSIPRIDKPYGKEIRELFEPSKGAVMLGFDASGLELRCLAHYMARYDGGAYRDILLNGDIHTENQIAAGLPTRDNAKTFIYAFL